jgi:hypothetical protein
MKLMRFAVSFFIGLALFPCGPVWAVRPFITDDARVTPLRTFLTESSVRLDSSRYQNLNLFALGVTSKLEATIGFTDGVLVKDDGNQSWQMSAAGPLVQIKYLFNEQKGVNGFPAVGIAAGIAPPWGLGAKNFAPDSWSEFAFLMVSKTFSAHPERLNLHVNIGGTNNHRGDGMGQDFTWGVGLQYLLYRDIVFGVTEIVSGDPYGVSKGAIYQVGLRFFLSDQMQLDVSYGAGLYGNPLPGGFFGFGLRFLTDPLW